MTVIIFLYPVGSPELHEADRLHPILIDFFSEHVKNMHENRDKRFDREYQVCSARPLLLTRLVCTCAGWVVSSLCSYCILEQRVHTTHCVHWRDCKWVCTIMLLYDNRLLTFNSFLAHPLIVMLLSHPATYALCIYNETTCSVYTCTCPWTNACTCACTIHDAYNMHMDTCTTMAI